jgi:SSS family solute:Na+ symporter/sodium/pantothenate symporter
MGFPSLVYQYGWVLALWIASYMMVPLCTFAILGKRMGQLARQTGAITLPELLRERFQSPALGMAASTLMIFILAFALIAQFKGRRHHPAEGAAGSPGAAWSVGGQSPEFMLGLAIFTFVVVTYTVTAASWRRSGRTSSRAC